MHNPIQAINVKSGMPRTAEARERLMQAIDAAKKSHVPVLKVIHGYGSTGQGGVLKETLRNALIRRRSEGWIGRIVYGEKWSIFEEAARDLIWDYPGSERDYDLDRGNEGITIVEIRNWTKQSGK